MFRDFFLAWSMFSRAWESVNISRAQPVDSVSGFLVVLCGVLSMGGVELDEFCCCVGHRYSSYRHRSRGFYLHRNSSVIVCFTICCLLDRKGLRHVDVRMAPDGVGRKLSEFGQCETAVVPMLLVPTWQDQSDGDFRCAEGQTEEGGGAAIYPWYKCPPDW